VHGTGYHNLLKCVMLLLFVMLHQHILCTRLTIIHFRLELYSIQYIAILTVNTSATPFSQYTVHDIAATAPKMSENTCTLQVHVYVIKLNLYKFRYRSIRLSNVDNH